MEKLHINDNTLSYSRVGTGPVLLFLHGFLGDQTVWNYTVEHLLLDYTCVAMDLPGHGKSEIINSNYTFDSLASNIVSILDLEQIDEVHIIGHSLGGYVGLSIAQLVPDRVKSITLLNSTAYADSPEKKIERDRASQVFDLSPKIYIKSAIQNLVHESNHSRLEKEIEELVEIALKLSVAGAKAALVAMRDRRNSVPFLMESQLPVHLISGKYDHVCPLDRAYEQVQDLNAVHTILNHSGHMAFIEEPDEMLKHIRLYLKHVI
jgi:pimeloyl-ACP methyl ester carboxylesterase